MVGPYGGAICDRAGWLVSRFVWQQTAGNVAAWWFGPAVDVNNHSASRRKINTVLSVCFLAAQYYSYQTRK